MANNAEDFRNIIVRQTPDGGAIRIRDIAQVIDGFDTAKFSAKFNGENAAIFQVASPDNTNVSLAGKSIRKFEEEINAKLKVEKQNIIICKTVSCHPKQMAKRNVFEIEGSRKLSRNSRNRKWS